MDTSISTHISVLVCLSGYSFSRCLWCWQQIFPGHFFISTKSIHYRQDPSPRCYIQELMETGTWAIQHSKGHQDVWVICVLFCDHVKPTLQPNSPFPELCFHCFSQSYWLVGHLLTKIPLCKSPFQSLCLRIFDLYWVICKENVWEKFRRCW